MSEGIEVNISDFIQACFDTFTLEHSLDDISFIHQVQDDTLIVSLLWQGREVWSNEYLLPQQEMNSKMLDFIDGVIEEAYLDFIHHCISLFLSKHKPPRVFLSSHPVLFSFTTPKYS